MVTKIYTRSNKIFTLNGQWLKKSNSLIEDYAIFNGRVNGDNTGYTGPTGYYLIRLNDNAIRYLLPPWGDIRPGYIYNSGQVRGNSLFVPNFMDTDGYWYSNDLGNSWSKVQIGNNGSSEPLSVRVSQDEKYILYIDRTTGLWVSSDHGNSFINKITDEDFYDSGINYDGTYMVAGSRYGGFYVSMDHGQSWELKYSGDVRGCVIMYKNNRAFFIDGDNGDVYEYDFSTDNYIVINSSILGAATQIFTAAYDTYFAAGDRNGHFLTYDGTFYSHDLQSLLPSDVNIGTYVSYDGRIISSGGNDETAISFDYGQTWEIFDPVNLNTF